MGYMRYMCLDGIESLISSAELTIVFDRWRVHYRRAVRGNPPEISCEELEEEHPGLTIENRKFGIHIVPKSLVERCDGRYLPLPMLITQSRLYRLLGRLRYAGVLAAPEWVEECLYAFKYQYDRGSELFARIIRYAASAADDAGDAEGADSSDGQGDPAEVVGA
jgi:hypothetical protein